MSSARRGVTLTELLVVLSILVILLAILVPALSGFLHTSRVVAAADTLAAFFRQARFAAMDRKVPVVPIILRDRNCRYTAVYAAQVASFKGQLTAATNPPITYAPAPVSQWSLTRQSLDLPHLQKGAFVFWLGAPTLDLNNLAAPQPWHEIMYLRATPPADPQRLNESSKYTYEILLRGVHNTARGEFTKASQKGGNADVYMVISGTNIDESAVGTADARDFTLASIGVNLPEHIVIDQVPAAEVAATREGPVCATVTAQCAIIREQSMFVAGGGQYEVSNRYPVFMPIFMPDGRVSGGLSRSTLAASEADRSWTGYVGQTIRVFDTNTREARFITIRSGGQVMITSKLPARAGSSQYGDDDSGVPTYEEQSSSSTSTASSTASSSTSSSSTASSSSTTTASSSSSTGTSSTTASSSASTSTNSSTSSSSNSSTSSTSNSSNSSTSSTSNSSNSSTASTSSSTGTSSTTSSTNSSTSNSSSTSSTSNSSSTSSSSSSTSGGQTSSTGGSSGGSSGGDGGSDDDRKK
jgi:prepilin-type N-terminal cleavage/methylation domain-containing protein